MCSYRLRQFVLAEIKFDCAYVQLEVSEFLGVKQRISITFKNTPFYIYNITTVL